MNKILGFYQIIGGVTGVVIVLLAFSDGPFNGVLVIGMLLFILSVIAGINLMKGTDKIISYVNFSLQALSFNFYQYYTLGAFTIYFSSNLNIGFDFNIGSHFTLIPGEIDSVFGVGINIIPILLLVQLSKVKLEAAPDTHGAIDSEFLKKE